MNEVPQRIGDAERDAAVDALRAHHEAGRLDLAEFDERMSTALSARTTDQLGPLFRDLPPVDANPQALAVPGANTVAEPAATQTKPESTAGRKVVGVISALVWPVALVINFAFGWNFWWLFLIAIFVVPALWQVVGGQDETRGRQHSRRH